MAFFLCWFRLGWCCDSIHRGVARPLVMCWQPCLVRCPLSAGDSIHGFSFIHSPSIARLLFSSLLASPPGQARTHCLLLSSLSRRQYPRKRTRTEQNSPEAMNFLARCCRLWGWEAGIACNICRVVVVMRGREVKLKTSLRNQPALPLSLSLSLFLSESINSHTLDRPKSQAIALFSDPASIPFEINSHHSRSSKS